MTLRVRFLKLDDRVDNNLADEFPRHWRALIKKYVNHYLYECFFELGETGQKGLSLAIQAVNAVRLYEAYNRLMLENDDPLSLQSRLEHEACTVASQNSLVFDPALVGYGTTDMTPSARRRLVERIYRDLTSHCQLK